MWRNMDAPIRNTGPRGNQLRAHVNFSGERIEFVLVITGSDGQLYCNARSQFPLSEGWIVGAISGPSALSFASDPNLGSRRAIDWTRTRTRTDIDIDWFLLRTNNPERNVGPSRVDRETTLTPQRSPEIPYNYDGGLLERYFIVDVERETFGGWRKVWTLPSGGILAPMVRISWRERIGGTEVARELWVPADDGLAPLPGLNDCLRVDSRGRCEGANTQPLAHLRYNQSFANRHINFYTTLNSWIYRRVIIGALYVNARQGYLRLPHSIPVQYPVYVFKNIGILSGTSSSVALAEAFPAYYIPYDSPAWWRVHIASIYENVPYEWGGKHYAAQASGRYLNGTDNRNMGFGLDCSGLIAVARERAGDSLYGTRAIERETYELVHRHANGEPMRDSQRNKLYQWAGVRPGDVLLRLERGQEHVMLVVRNQCIAASPTPSAAFYRITYIEAVGVNPRAAGNHEVVEKVRYISGSGSSLLGTPGYDPDDFVPRRFNGE